jgi:hypothetical protein
MYNTGTNHYKPDFDEWGDVTLLVEKPLQAGL